MTIVGTSSPKDFKASVVMVLQHNRWANHLVHLAAKIVIALQGFSVPARVKLSMVVKNMADVYCLPLEPRVLHLQIARQLIVPHTPTATFAQSLRSVNHVPSPVNVRSASFAEFPPTRALKIIPSHSMSLL